MVGGSVRKSAYDIPERNFSTFEVTIVSRSYDKLTIIVRYFVNRAPGFDLPRHTWSLVNRFRTGQGQRRANLHKGGLAQSPSCDCGQRQTMDPTVDTRAHHRNLKVD